MKKKRGMAWLLSFLLVFSLMVGTSAMQVRAEETDSGEEKTISVSLTDAAGCLDTYGSYMKMDGVEITPGSIRVKPADTHIISLLPTFGIDIAVTINGSDINGTKNDGWMDYTVAEEDSYDIVVKKAGSSVYTVVWTYDSSLGEDAKVSNGTVKILSAITADNQNGIGAINDQTDQKGLVEIKPGSTVTVEIKPDYGYQFVAGALNGQTVTAGETVSQFTFTMPKTNLHLSALFTPKADKVSVNSSKITAGKIANGQNAIDSGNLQLAISDASESAVADAEEMKEKAGDAKIQLYLTMGLSQVVNKGNESTVWENPLTDLKGSVSVTLSLPENLKNESGTFYVIREHKNSDGTTTYDRIQASHNKSDGTITFPTNKFSTYALAYDADTPDNGGTDGDSSDSGNGGSSNTGNSGSSSGTGSTSSVSSSSNSTVAATAKKVSPVVVQEQTNAQGQLCVDIAASPEHARLTKEILQKYNGTDTNLMIHLGNGVGFSADLTGGAISDQVDFGAAFSEIPNFAEVFTTYYMKPAEPQKLPGTVGIHLHVGEEYAGHVAYLFTLDRTTGLYQLHSTVTVNAIGNVMLESQELTDVMILIGK